VRAHILLNFAKDIEYYHPSDDAKVKT